MHASLLYCDCRIVQSKTYTFEVHVLHLRFSFTLLQILLFSGALRTYCICNNHQLLVHDFSSHRDRSSKTRACKLNIPYDYNLSFSQFIFCTLDKLLCLLLSIVNSNFLLCFSLPITKQYHSLQVYVTHCHKGNKKNLRIHILLQKLLSKYFSHNSIHNLLQDTI